MLRGRSSPEHPPAQHCIPKTTLVGLRQTHHYPVQTDRSRLARALRRDPLHRPHSQRLPGRAPTTRLCRPNFDPGHCIRAQCRPESWAGGTAASQADAPLVWSLRSRLPKARLCFPRSAVWTSSTVQHCCKPVAKRAATDFIPRTLIVDAPQHTRIGWMCWPASNLREGSPPARREGMNYASQATTAKH